MQQLEKRPDESQFEYQRRLVYGKLVDKTLSDCDYSELAEYLYGQPYSTDVARRMMYGSRNTIEAIENDCVDSIDDMDVSSRLDEKIIEFKKEQQKFFDQRRELSKIISNEARAEHLYDSLINSAKGLNETIGRMYSDHTSNIDYGESEAVLVLSDWHYGLKTENIFNVFNTDICKERVANVTKAAIEKINLHKCKNLHIVILGDLYHGAIHTSARVASEELVCDQLMQVSEILAQTIYKLSNYVNNTYVYMTYGNHARTVQDKKDNIHRDNMERIIPWWLRQRFSDNENIIVREESENEFILLNVCNYGICASHGDNDSVKSSSKLLYTLFQKKYGVDVECVLLGDKHHRESYEELGIASILCGSLCGSDEYANNKRLYSTPSQLLLIINECGLDAEYRIKCE